MKNHNEKGFSLRKISPHLLNGSCLAVFPRLIICCEKIQDKALEVISNADQVLETKEIQEQVEVSIKDITRTKLFARLNDLRGEGLIKGKFVGPGKGVWIWWRADAFKNSEGGEK